MSRKKSFKDETLEHSKKYSDLIGTYVDNVEQNATLKRKLKERFFLVTMSILIALTAIFILAIGALCIGVIVNKVTGKFIVSIITIIAPVLSSLLVALLKIPKIIAKYLFNKKEDKSMNKLIRDIQLYDKNMIEFEYKMNMLLKNERVENDASSPQSEQNIVLNEVPSGDNLDIINNIDDENELSSENNSNISNN